jgi:hypothetical protein
MRAALGVRIYFGSKRSTWSPKSSSLCRNRLAQGRFRDLTHSAKHLDFDLAVPRVRVQAVWQEIETGGKTSCLCLLSRAGVLVMNATEEREPPGWATPLDIASLGWIFHRHIR